MSTSQIFSLAGTIAALQWLILIILPKWRITQWLIRNPVIPVLLSVIYCIYIAGFFYTPGGGYNSLQQVRTLFADDRLLLAGWVHYLAFDLLIGFCIVRSSQERSVPHWLIIPSLMLTFMFGPCGYLLYQIIKRIKSHESAI